MDGFYSVSAIRVFFFLNKEGKNESAPLLPDLSNVEN